MIFYFTLLLIVVYAKDTVARSKLHFNSKPLFGKLYFLNYIIICLNTLHTFIIYTIPYTYLFYTLKFMSKETGKNLKRVYIYKKVIIGYVFIISM